MMPFAAFAAFAAALALALAAPAPAQPLPEALKGVPRAAGSCTRDAAGGGGVPVPEVAPPDLRCALAPAELAASALLVDMRPRAEHDTWRLSGTLQMGVPELRSKPMLRDRAIVLVGSGKAERELYAACAALKQQGFGSVKVLRGGMAAWRGAGRPVDGQAPEWAELARLSPAELWSESQFEANLVLVAPEQAGMQAQLPLAVPVREAGAAAVKALIERRRKELKGAPLAAVVLVAAPGADLRALAQSLHPVPLLFYADTAAHYARQIAQQRAVWNAHARGPRQPGCGT